VNSSAGMFSFLNGRERCRQNAQETISTVLLGAVLYAMLRMYRNFEDEIVPVSLKEIDSTKSDGAVAVAYFTSIFHITAAVKCVPAFLAAAHVFRMNRLALRQVKGHTQTANAYSFYLIAGMILCAGGDYWLDIDSCKDDTTVAHFLQVLKLPVPPFIVGLVSFLLGHVAFILAFYRDGGNSLLPVHGVVLYLYAAGIVYVIMAFGNIRADDIVLKVGVVVYSLVIATMCHRSMSLSLDAYPGLESTFYATAGSLTFLLSDSLLAYNRFVAPFPLARVCVLATYFLSLGLIASSAAGMARWKVGWD